MTTKFTTKIPVEVKELTWNVKNFAVILGFEEQLKDVNMTFDAGDSIGLPTRWKLYFEKTNFDDRNDELAIFLKLLECPKGRKHVFASARFANVTRKAFKFPDPLKPMEPKDYRKCAWECTSNNTVMKIPKSEVFIVNDTLILRIQFTLYKFEPEPNSGEIDSQLCEDSQMELTNNFKKLLNSGEKSDVIFQMKDGKTLKAHAAILIAQCPFFSAMFRASKTDSSEIIYVEDLNYKAMKVILLFIYTGELLLGDGWEDVIEQVVYGAEKYQLPLLKKFIDKALGKMCKNENASDLLTLAEQYGMKVAEKEIREYIEIKNCSEFYDRSQGANVKCFKNGFGKICKRDSFKMFVIILLLSLQFDFCN